MTGTTTGLSSRIRRAVRAELARRGKSGMDLIPVLGLGRNAIYDRLNGSIALDSDELEKILVYLGITLDTLLASAALDVPEAVAS
jgi:hypothetical protein